MKTDRATWISMLISIPAAVGLAVLSGPITRLIFPGTNGVGGQLLILGGITIILNGNSNISNGVLQGIGKPNQFDDPQVKETRELVARTARKHGKFAGTVGGPGNFDDLVKMGYTFISVGADVVALWQYFLDITGKIQGRDIAEV